MPDGDQDTKRPSHDISLEEFDDEDLSEITDDCGIGLNYDSDPYEKDCLILEKSDVHHTICSFQDDFQEFEMIDDDEEDDDEDEEEEEEGTDPEAPPSPSVSLPSSPIISTLQKSRPTTLNLTNAVSQDSLNNNGSFSPRKASWQDSLRNPPSHGCLSPAHSCLEDSAHTEGRCLATPGTGSPSKGTPQKQVGDAEPPESVQRPTLYDFEGNRREQQQEKVPDPATEDHNMNILSPPPSPLYSPFSDHWMAPKPCLSPTALFDQRKRSSSSDTGVVASAEPVSPSELQAADELSQCSDTEVDHDLNSDYGNRCHSRQANHTYTVTTESANDPELDNDDMTFDGTSKCLSSTVPVDGDAATPLTDEELDGEFEVDVMSKESYDAACREASAYVEFPPIEPPSEGASFSHYTPSSSSSSSRSEAGLVSAPGVSAHRGANASCLLSSDPCVTDEGEQGSDHYAESDPGSSDGLSSPVSDSDIEGELEAAFVCSGPLAGHMVSSISETELDLTSDSSSSGQSSNLTSSLEEACSSFSDPDPEPKAPLRLHHTHPVKEEAPPPAAPLHLDDSQSFYLPVGPRLLPAAAPDSDGNSESESESEDELSENSDSPWLLSNLVSRMISEGSTPISCPEDCFKRPASTTGTISPSSDLEAETGNERSSLAATGGQGEGAPLEASTRDRSLSPDCSGEPGGGSRALAPCLFLTNPTQDTITPIFLDQSCSGPAHPTETEHPHMLARGIEPEMVELGSNQSVEDTGGLGERVADVDQQGSLDHMAEVKSGLTLDIRGAQTDHSFGLAYSSDNEDSHFPYGEEYLDSSPPIDESVRMMPPTDRARHMDESLAYDSMKYTLVVDENTTLELGGTRPDEDLLSSSEDSSPEADAHFSKKFLNIFVNSTSRSSSTESFGLFSCTIDGEEREQTHRAVFRFIPRHTDELELDVDDPLFVEEEEDDYWYRGYNMRTGERGIFPAYYAHLVVGQAKSIMGMKRSLVWMESFSVQFLGSVEVPYHQGNGILCAAMQKIAMVRKQTVHLRPPAVCELEISPQGVKLVMSLEDDFSAADEFDRCSHFFQMKNISFCGCHPKSNCYFGFITKHPMLNRFACHVFVSQESMRQVAECVGRAFQEYYQEHLEYACPTEDIYLE
ncbi:hypothetical protein AGOR_G00016820 [Albula goreensis]|uniref:Mitogen-activated protein kinase 8 interacting protein 2 n=1 Tax=Albula goreensis TaxID=1534307 RepID=A0A8T3ECI1_9TELE|nr:hypothetical protein AGOR_G00016820 [Albula goreensis]